MSGIFSESHQRPQYTRLQWLINFAIVLQPAQFCGSGNVMNEQLSNYYQLVEKVDGLCRAIEEALSGYLTCREGCGSCCKAITLFPVEAAALQSAMAKLPDDQAEAIRRHVAANPGNDACPLLKDDRCLLYAARPIICRTHGLPIMFTENGQRRVDYCPLNLQGLEKLPGTAVINLDNLNQLLVAVNANYLQQCGKQVSAERVGIREAILGMRVR